MINTFFWNMDVFIHCHVTLNQSPVSADIFWHWLAWKWGRFCFVTDRWNYKFRFSTISYKLLSSLLMGRCEFNLVYTDTMWDKLCQSSDSPLYLFWHCASGERDSAIMISWLPNWPSLRSLQGYWDALLQWGEAHASHSGFACIWEI